MGVARTRYTLQTIVVWSWEEAHLTERFPPEQKKKLRMNNRATPQCADEEAKTKVLAHVRGLKSVPPQLSSSMQPRSDHQRRSSDHPMQSEQTPTAARRSAGVGAAALA